MKFFHTADVHLGAEPDRGFPWSRDRSQELWESFRNVIRQAGAEHADLFLIAGDLFHRQPLVRELKEVNALFASIPDTRIVLMAGNHDPMKQNSAYRNFPWAKNVSWFWDPMPETLEFPELGISVTGLSYDRKEIREPLYDRIRAGGRQPCKILLAHGGDDRHIPFLKNGFWAQALTTLPWDTSINPRNWSGIKCSIPEPWNRLIKTIPASTDILGENIGTVCSLPGSSLRQAENIKGCVFR